MSINKHTAYTFTYVNLHKQIIITKYILTAEIKTPNTISKIK